MASEFKWIGQSVDKKTVTLHKFETSFQFPTYASDQWMVSNKELIRHGLVVDLETTGLSFTKNEIIEVGMRAFQFNRESGEVLRVSPALSQLQQPSEPLNPLVRQLTGLTDEMLEGKNIQWNEVDQYIESADLIIAHNAHFDRPFLETKSSLSKSKVWACTHRQIDWLAKGYSSSKLELLCIYHGFFVDAHRALSDVDGLLHLISMQDATTQHTYLTELLRNTRRPQAKVKAKNSPYETKDLLKVRGYTWDRQERVWSKALYKDELDGELDWLSQCVYEGEFRGIVENLPITDRFKATAIDA